MTCNAAAAGGHQMVLREHGATWDEDTCRYAARGGQMEILQ